MARFPFTRRRSDKDARQQAMKDAVAVFAKAMGAPGSATPASVGAKYGNTGNVMPGSQFQGGWNNLGNSAMAMYQRVTASMSQQFDVPIADIEAELVEQGMTWGPPFPPGRPLDPFFGYRRPPRTWDFTVGENVQITPRWNRISFQTIKGIYDAYDVAQICLTPGVEIMTRRGLVPIERVEVGDEVLTHRGRFRRVYKTMANPIGDRGARRIVAGGLEPIVATDDHPFLAARYTHTQSRRRVMRALDWVNAEELEPRGDQKQANWHYDAAVLPSLTFEDASDTLDLPTVLGSDFEDQDGHLVQFFHSRGRGAVATRRRVAQSAPLPSRVPLDARLGRLLGWYLAEGSQEGGSVTFTLSDTERDEADQIVADGKAVFGLDARIRATSAGRAIHVIFYSSALARLFQCGTARFKRIPDWAWNAPRGFFEAMLDAWALGDGCVSVRPDKPSYSPRVMVVTTSKTLAWQMRLVAIAIGHKATVIEHRHPDSVAIIRGREVRSERHYTVEWGTDPQRTGRYSFEENGRILTTAIKTVQPAVYEGTVYNIEVEDDHSYVTTGGTVHNCVRHLINDVRSLDYSWVPAEGVRDDVSGEIDACRAFFEYPDKRLPFRNWLAEYLQDVLRYDAGALYIRRSADGTPVALECVDGTTLIPNVDFYGRVAADEDDDNPPADGLWPGGAVPGYQQIIEGMPWVWLTADDLLYIPWNPLPESQYGLAPLEAVLLTANTDIRFQWHFLQYFTEGTIPAGFMEAPPDLSDPTQIAEWQETWDALMLGDQSKLRQIRWVPNGAKYTAIKSGDFDEKFPLYLMRRTVAAFGVTPNDLGFTENTNRSVGETQVDVQFRVGTQPLLRHVESVINMFIVREFGWRARLKIDSGRETEDRVAVAQAHGVYIDKGVLSTDEVRAELGKPIDRSRPMPRTVNNPRVGLIPLLAALSLAGKIDEDTYAPAGDQDLIPNPYMPAPGVIPQMGTPELKAVNTASAAMGDHMLQDTTGSAPTPEMQQAIAAATPPPPGASQQGPAGTTAQPAQTPPLTGAGATPQPATGQASKLMQSNPGGISSGLGANSGIQGASLHSGEDDEDEDALEDAEKTAEAVLELRRWRENARNRLRKGQAPRRFRSTAIDPEVADLIWSRLQTARDRREVNTIFADVVAGRPFRPGQRSRIRRPQG